MTLKTVLEWLAAHESLSDTRRRDLRSAIRRFAKLLEKTPAAIPLDLAEIRRTLDETMPARSNISGKRWHNLRSDLAAAIASSRLRPMLKTAEVELDPIWANLLRPAERRIQFGLSRFARWATLRRIAPDDVNDDTLDRFIAELDAASLIRNLEEVRPTISGGGTPSSPSTLNGVCTRLRRSPARLRPSSGPGATFQLRFRRTSHTTSPGLRSPIHLRRGRALEPSHG